MIFSSILFIFRFLPIALILYYITPTKNKNIVLIFLSLFFYSWGEGKYFVIMLSSIIVDYIIGILIYKYKEDRKKALNFLWVSLIFNIGILFVFKYFNFFIENINSIFSLNIGEVSITLPLGISFYTFQTMSYSIDVFKGKIKAENNIINFAAFVTLFPQLIAGPIVKYTDIEDEIKNRIINLENLEEGVEKFILGLSAKVLIANNVGGLWNEVESLGFNNISTILGWIGIIAFSLQIYFDFYGYSLMAIGIGKMLGFTFPINFNYPYISRSITEFWRRWHITLGEWFKEYVYIPLGGSRRGKGRLILNLFLVWLLTGLWHGASYNFLLWGILFFTLIVIEKFGLLVILDKYKVVSHIYTVFFLLLGWSIFAITDINELLAFLKKLFIYSEGTEWIYYMINYGASLSIAIILTTPILSKIYYKIKEVRWLKTLILILLFIVSISYLVDATYNPFLYFRF